MAEKYIGKTYPIHDAELKVTGEQQYTSDIKFEKMLDAKFLFSNVAHAKIKSMDISQAEKLDGVVKVFTPFNTTDKKFNSYIFFIDENCPKDERILNDKVRLYGDRIAAVVATRKDIAEEALELIKVEYENLPVIVDIEKSLNEKENLIHDSGNIITDNTLSIGNAEKVIRESKITYKDEVFMQRVHHAAMENHSCIAKYENNEITIWTPCQSAFAVRNTVAQFLDMSYSHVRVIKNTMGGSFGGKQQVILELLTAYLASETKSTVKLEYTRKDSILSTTIGTSIKYKIESAVENNKIIAMDIKSLQDAGAYVGNSIDLGFAAGKKAYRTYKIPNLCYNTKSVYTNAPAAGGFRGWGNPQMTTAIELHMDRLAKECHMNPVDFRLNNAVDPYDMEPFSNLTLGNATIKSCITEGAKEFNWYERYEQPKPNGRYRTGVGMACAGHINGFYGKIQDMSSMILKMNEDGSFILNTALHDQGCGTLTSMQLILAEVLDVSLDKIKVLEADTNRSPYDIGTYSSRVTYVCGKCAFNVADKIKKQILETAALILNKRVSYMRIENGYVYVDGDVNTRISYRDIASIAQVQYEKEIIAVETYANTSNPGAYAAHFCEVRVDTYTGMVDICDYLAVHDVGKVINRGMVEGQIHGGVQMGLGYALSEEIKINENGIPKTTNFKDYVVFNTTSMPKVKTKLLECGGDDGPFEAKSIGEVAIIPVIACVANAVNNALGVQITTFPMTPERIISEIVHERGDVYEN